MASESACSAVIIGDVHGCLSELKMLLDECKYDWKGILNGRHDPLPELVFVGDLVGKGPDSVGVVRFVRELGKALALFIRL